MLNYAGKKTLGGASSQLCLCLCGRPRNTDSRHYKHKQGGGGRGQEGHTAQIILQVSDTIPGVKHFRFLYVSLDALVTADISLRQQ